MSSSEQEHLARLERLANTHNTGFLALRAGSVLDLYPFDGVKGVTLLKLSSVELRTALDSADSSRPDVREQLLSAAFAASQRSIELKQKGEVLLAAFYCRFAMLVACRYQQWEGMRITSSNLWLASHAIRDLLHSSAELPPLRASLGDAHASETSLFLNAYVEVNEADFLSVLELLRGDADDLSSRIRRTLAATRHSGSCKPDELSALHTLRRLSALAGNALDPQYNLSRLITVADQLNRPADAFLALLESFADASLEDLLGILGIEKSAQEVAHIWGEYLARRAELGKLADTPSLQMVVAFAVQNAQLLRSHVVRAGGSFGMRVSYRISEFLQPIGRDLVQLLNRDGAHHAALDVAERLRARALGDWLARSHPSRRWATGRRQSGSMGAILTAGSEEIAAVAAHVGASVLIYLADADGHSVWLQEPTGEMIVARVGKLDAVIQRVFATLRFGIGEGAEYRDIVCSEAEAEGAALPAEREAALTACYKAAIPPIIDEQLHGRGDRLIIVADGLLEYVPFAALMTPRRRYLVEEREIHFWPSVSAWLVLEGARNARLSDPRGAPRVIGDPAFAPSFLVRRGHSVANIMLSRLPGAAMEARDVSGVLGVAPLIGSDARRSAVLDCNARCPILHLATHGVSDTSYPEDSFVALADGPITAGELYERPLPVDLVVLSACQTALGANHPDSIIGLTNAFLVAGTCSVVSTLWKVPDIPTAALMQDFYQELLQGASIPAALRHAQLRALGGDVLDWGAFKVVGLGDNPLQPLE